MSKSLKRVNFIQLAHRDSRTLTAAAKRAPEIVEKVNKELLYYTIVLTCVFGGKKNTRMKEQELDQGKSLSSRLQFSQAYRMLNFRLSSYS